MKILQYILIGAILIIFGFFIGQLSSDLSSDSNENMKTFGKKPRILMSNRGEQFIVTWSLGELYTVKPLPKEED